MNRSCLIVLGVGFCASCLASENWPSFRGGGDGQTVLEGLPVEWSDSSHVVWRVDLAGYGQSSPVIWEGQLFVTSTAGDQKESLFVEGFNLSTGESLWKTEVKTVKTVKEVSQMISQGAPTPVVDREGIYAFFESGDFVGLSLDGKIRWQRNLQEEFGDFVGNHGIGSSPVATPEGIALLLDHSGPSYLLMVDRETGEDVWKSDREPRVSWSSPLFLEHEGTPQILLSSNGEISSYHALTGERLWWVDGVKSNTVASPSSNGDLVFVGSSEPQNCFAIRLGGEGDVSESHRTWFAESVTSSFGSPIVNGDEVLYVNRAGALQATSISDGSLRWERRLPDSTWASPLLTMDYLYFFCKNGTSVVFERSTLGEDSEPVATNLLTVPDEDRVYGYAAANGTIVIRTGRGLIAVKGE